jgi:hypothetical protein
MREPTLKIIFNDLGTPFTVRLVAEGESYGRNMGLVHDKPEPLVEFYDFRYPFESINETVLGQFVSRYRLSTVLEVAERGCGINLMGGEPDWVVSAENIADIARWEPVRTHAPEARQQKGSELDFAP